MTGFTVEPARLKEIAAAGRSLDTTISYEADEIIHISKNVSTLGGSLGIVAAQLRIQGEQVRDLSYLADTYYRTLSEISDLYETADRAACDNGVPEIQSTRS